MMSESPRPYLGSGDSLSVKVPLWPAGIPRQNANQRMKQGTRRHVYGGREREREREKERDRGRERGRKREIERERERNRGRW